MVWTSADDNNEKNSPTMFETDIDRQNERAIMDRMMKVFGWRDLMKFTRADIVDFLATNSNNKIFHSFYLVALLITIETMG
ncbi:MAG: hypothetical protein IMZ52_00890 [Actinobacteria bacterium]|nr:hypothetical protein [Actinomycetota bacterium]MBE3122000.1 hypothetical protein [Thermoplasmata archaeon]